MRKRLNEAGYTLVEVLIVVTVMGILLAVIGTFALGSFTQTSVESVRASQLGESQIAMDRVINDIRLAAGADSTNRWPDANNSAGTLAWSSNANTLVLATIATNASNNVIFADASKYISEKNSTIYFVKNGNLYKRVLAAPVAGNSAKTSCPQAVASASCPADKLMLSNVVSFSLKYFDGANAQVTPTNARSVELTVNTSTKRFSQTIKSNYTTRAVFRND